MTWSRSCFLVTLFVGLTLTAANDKVTFTEKDQRGLRTLDDILEKTKKLPEIVCQNSNLCLRNDDSEITEIGDEDSANMWLDILNEVEMYASYEISNAHFRYQIDITLYNEEYYKEMRMKSSKLGIEIKKQARKFETTGFSAINKRKFFLLLQGADSDDEEMLKLSSDIGIKMQSIYSKGTVCVDDSAPESLKELVQQGILQDCLKLEPDLENIMATSRNEEELRWVWEKWRDAVGPSIGKYYPLAIDIDNKFARNGGYANNAENLLERYEMEGFEEYVYKLWDELRPLYLQLHAYVRRKLKDFYGADVVPGKTIPAHLLGNMWGQLWAEIYDIVEPYPQAKIPDVTEKLKRKGYTVKQMFSTAEKFFISIGLDPMPKTFWEKSMLERPEDPEREVVCHGSAHDLSIDLDVRIKMCTEITMEDLYTIHHEMGHIEYFLMYRKQPMVFRAGANAGFHEAVGDTIALSVVTPSYLYHLGLVDTVTTSYETNINYLMKTALEKVAFLPFGLLIDSWRWKVYRGEITRDEYNDKWWELRYKFQGIHPPVQRSDSDFDPGAKYHIAAKVPYIRYFVSFIIQFQFQRALCEEQDYTKILHECNIYQSTEAGAKLRNMLEMGKSSQWQDTLEVLTGSRDIDPSAIKDYFKPLLEWLEEQNEGEEVGWEEDGWKLFV